ncbi:MAG: ATP-dependent zinc metalloprotease FtsH [Planctomycetes bacterium]|nr:ATP-dependent zinc metalloprotease FtsH [Planctomycetota bacterium]
MVHLLTDRTWSHGKKKKSLQLNEFWSLMERNRVLHFVLTGTEAEAEVKTEVVTTEDGKKLEGFIFDEGDPKAGTASPEPVLFHPLNGEPVVLSRILTREDGEEKVTLEVQFPLPENYLSWEVLERIRLKLPSAQFEYRPPPFPFKQFLIGIAPWILFLVFIWILFLRQMRVTGGSSVLSFGKSRARMLSGANNRVTFDDVAGIEEAKEEVREIIEFLRNPEKFQRLGGRIPRGILLVGSPGTGKTLLAKAIAGEADVPFFSISGSDFVEMFVGVGASRVRDLFRQAKQHSPCIIFLDEVDAVGRRRGTGLGGGHDEREQTLNAILVEMDGFDSDSGVILLAATNRPELLDPALLRPGRFDRHVVVDLPDVKGREAILQVHARDKKLGTDVDLARLAKATPFFSGADLENLMNEAALLAGMNGQDTIGQKDLEMARDKVQWGREKKSHVLHDEEKVISAYHETGHAMVSRLTPGSDPLHKVTIIPRGMALGATHFIPEYDYHIMSRKRILADITVLLAGRAAEETFLEDITSGAQNDFKRATDLARMMICKWGMSERLGPVFYSDEDENIFLGRDFTRVKTLSEETAVVIDQEIKLIVEQCYQQAKRVLADHRQEIILIAQALLKYETLDAEEIEALLAGKPIRQAGEPDVQPAASGGGPTS